MPITPFAEADTEEVVHCWNTLGPRHSLCHPMTPAKLAQLVLTRPWFVPEGFLLARDARGIAGGIVIGQDAATPAMALIQGLFDRGGDPGPGARAALAAGLEWARARGAATIRTGHLASVDSHDLRRLEFWWQHRFVVPGSYDCVIDQQIAATNVFMRCDLKRFAIPPAIRALEAELGRRGYTVAPAAGPQAAAVAAAAMPFARSLAKALATASPLEAVFLAVDNQGTPVGGALASQPGAPTGWPEYGCECGLFGPIGVATAHRGGLGKVLLFRTLGQLRDWQCAHALIPIAPSIVPFYAQAGARVQRVTLVLQRPTGTIVPKIRNPPATAAQPA